MDTDGKSEGKGAVLRRILEKYDSPLLNDVSALCAYSLELDGLVLYRVTELVCMYNVSGAYPASRYMFSASSIPCRITK